MTSTQFGAVETVTALLVEELKKSTSLKSDKKDYGSKNVISESIETACCRAALRLIQTAIELADTTADTALNNKESKWQINPLSVFGNSSVIEKLVEKAQVR